MIKVLLVDDQKLFSEGVRSLLSREEDMVVVGAASNGKEAMEKMLKHEPDVVLMDIHMPQVDGIKATIQIKEHFPKTKVILLTTFADEELVLIGKKVGADGFLLKDLSASHVIRSIRDAYHDEIVISGEAARILARQILQVNYSKKELLSQKLANREINLSARELDIAHLLMEETSNKHIAQRLFLSEGTIKNYISEIYNKVNIHNRKEVIAYLQGLFSKKSYW
ncbi:DNA-binding response regulator [Virgibacillus indicus]|uniref:DNA-binding response regulator n=1 Tax=Virgibacillus indicus TaxID=2024554 RepID=A0A265N8U6_9BACI|nr:response regulator transcription factor [Virgibacillus indicus]OZU88245.1 DNA-binding response regulator [Virgibacillus indicus]